MRGLIFFFLFSFLLGGCINSPTTVSDSDMSLIQRAYEFEKANRPVKINPETVVLDTRAFFDYQISRVPKSIYVEASEFSLRRQHGDDLEKKALKLARRFALMGITPFTHVVVVGYGVKGKGEEGALALTLLTLGVERVQVSTFESLRFLATAKSTQTPANQRYWEPRVVTSVSCTSHSLSDGFVIDVSGKNSGPMSIGGDKRIATLVKDPKDFVNADDFSPNYKVKSLLKNNQLDENALIMVRGFQAPLVVFSLVQMGYKGTCMMDD